MTFRQHKPYFWSKLLLSMLAIFVLPVSQQVKYENPNHNYQNLQQVQNIQQVAELVAQNIQQTQSPPNVTLRRAQIVAKKDLSIKSQLSLNIPPIRAGPDQFA